MRVSQIAIALAQLLLVFECANNHSDSKVSATFRVFASRLRSGCSDTDFLTQRVVHRGQFGASGLSELLSTQVAATSERARETAATFTSFCVTNSDAHQDKLAIIFDTERRKLIDRFRLRDVRLDKGGLRPMLLAKPNGQPTCQNAFVGVRNLKALSRRANTERRQCGIIMDWAEAQSPSLMVSDSISIGECRLFLALPSAHRRVRVLARCDIPYS